MSGFERCACCALDGTLAEPRPPTFVICEPPSGVALSDSQTRLDNSLYSYSYTVTDPRRVQEQAVFASPRTHQIHVLTSGPRCGTSACLPFSITHLSSSGRRRSRSPQPNRLAPAGQMQEAIDHKYLASVCETMDHISWQPHTFHRQYPELKSAERRRMHQT